MLENFFWDWNLLHSQTEMSMCVASSASGVRNLNGAEAFCGGVSAWELCVLLLLHKKNIIIYKFQRVSMWRFILMIFFGIRLVSLGEYFGGTFGAMEKLRGSLFVWKLILRHSSRDEDETLDCVWADMDFPVKLHDTFSFLLQVNHAMQVFFLISEKITGNYPWLILGLDEGLIFRVKLQSWLST